MMGEEVLVNVVANVNPPRRWRSPTPAWSSWNGSWRRQRRRPLDPTPPAGSCSASWTTPLRPVRGWAARSTPWRAASGTHTHTHSDLYACTPTRRTLWMTAWMTAWINMITQQDCSAPRRGGPLSFSSGRAARRQLEDTSPETTSLDPTSLDLASDLELDKTPDEVPSAQPE